MSTPANARASGASGPFYRRWLQRFAALDDGDILRVAFYALLAGTAAVLFVDFRELTATEVASPAMPLQPILPPALDGPDPRPMPAITSDSEALRQPLQIELGAGGMLAEGDAIQDGFWQKQCMAQFSSRIGGGTNEVHRNMIGERALGLHALQRHRVVEGAPLQEALHDGAVGAAGAVGQHLHADQGSAVPQGVGDALRVGVGRRVGGEGGPVGLVEGQVVRARRGLRDHP